MWAVAAEHAAELTMELLCIGGVSRPLPLALLAGCEPSPLRFFAADLLLPPEGLRLAVQRRTSRVSVVRVPVFPNTYLNIIHGWTAISICARAAIIGPSTTRVTDSCGGKLDETLRANPFGCTTLT